jgi:hypothetical protein
VLWVKDAARLARRAASRTGAWGPASNNAGVLGSTVLAGAALLLLNAVTLAPSSAQPAAPTPAAPSPSVVKVTAYTPEQRVRWQRLFDAYRTYAIIQYCRETRRGYHIQWINEVELDRARSRVKKIEDEAKELLGDALDADQLFHSAQVDDFSRVKDVDAPTCRAAYLQMLETPTASGEVGIRIEKDF